MKDTLTSVRRTPFQSLAAFLVLFFTLLIATSIFVVLSFLYGLLNYLETRPQVTAYFQTTTKPEQIFKIREDLVASGKVLDAKYVSKEDAFKIYKQQNKDNPLLLEMVSADILPASLEIYAQKPTYLPEIASYLKTQTGIDEVVFQKDIFDRLLTLTSILRQTTGVLFIFLIIMAIVVLTTTTLFKIAMKKDEIELLRLLGASNFYIRKPFFVEGILFGIVASVISFTMISGILLYFNPFLISYLRGIPELAFNFHFFTLAIWPLNPIFLIVTFIISTLFGAGIALIASYIATNKYLT